MSKEKKIFFFFFIIFLCAFIVTGFLIVRNNIQRNKLVKEIHEIASNDIGKYKFDGELKCRGGFRKVERTIKVYLSDYSKNLEDINSIINDDKFKNLLSISNYKDDAPEFKNSLEYLDKQNKIYTEKIDLLIKSSDKDYIYNNIYASTKDKYFIELYKKIIIEEGIDTKYSKNKSNLVAHKEKGENVFKYTKAILDFLVANKGKWKIDGEQIKFDNQDLLNKYNGALAKIK